MKKRILTMLLAAVMMMALVPAVFAADGGWAPLSITAGYVDVTFSAAKIVKTPVKHWVDSNGSSFFVESDEEGQPLTTGMTQQDWPVTCVLLQPGSDVTVTYNEDFVEIVDTNDEAGASLYYMGYLEPGELLADVDFSKLVGKEAPLWSSTCMEKDGAYIIVETWWIRSGKVENGFSPVDTGIGRIIETDGGDCLVQVGDASAEPTVPESGTAYATPQNVLVDGKPVAFQFYALKDANGNDTNYVKARDLAYVLNSTAARFNVGWDGTAVILESGKAYTSNGTEMKTPFSGNRAYKINTAPIKVDGAAVKMESIVLTDDAGGGYTYYKLRDLGAALGFYVDWTAEKGVFIETK